MFVTCNLGSGEPQNGNLVRNMMGQISKNCKGREYHVNVYQGKYPTNRKFLLPHSHLLDFLPNTFSWTGRRWLRIHQNIPLRSLAVAKKKNVTRVKAGKKKVTFFRGRTSTG